MSPHRGFELGLRIAFAFGLSAAIVLCFRDVVFRLLLPLFLTEISWLSDDFRITGIGLGGSGADHYLYVHATLAQPVLVKDKMVYPADMGGGETFTLSGYVPQTIILYLGVLLAWPAAKWRAYPVRLVAGLPILMLMLMLDVPFTLVGFLRGNFDDPFWLRQYVDFLNYGGRLVLALLAGALAAIASEHLARNRKARIC